VRDVSHFRLADAVREQRTPETSIDRAREPEVGAPHPKAFRLQVPHEVMTDEAARPADEGYLSGTWLIRPVVLFETWLASRRQDLFENMKCQGGTLMRK
jgi:hypothetical protein